MKTFQNQNINDAAQITINNKIYLTYPNNKHSHRDTLTIKGQKYYFYATKLSE